MNSLPPESYRIRDPHSVFKTAYFAFSVCALLIASHNTAHALPILTSGSVENTLTLVTPANTFSLTTTATSPLGVYNQALIRTGFMNYSSGVGYSTNSQDSPNQYATGAAVEIDLAPYVVSPADGAGAADSYAYVGRGVFGYAGPYMNGSEEYYTLGEVRFRWRIFSFGTMTGSASQAVRFEITTDVPMGRVWLDDPSSTTELTLANSLPVGSHWFLVEFNQSEQITGTPESWASYESDPNSPNHGWYVNVSAVPEPSTYAMALAGLAYGGFSVWRRRKRGNKKRSAVVAASFALAAACLCTTPAHAVTIDMVMVGNPGNVNDTTGYGAVADAFQIMKYEFTNQQYTDFLNSVAATDTYSLYNTNMGSNARGGITRSGSPGTYSYSVKANMGDKPVNYVSWFDAARVANWLMNGATGTSSTETGAYTLVGGQTSGTAPARNSGATFYIPTEDQWYKAAYYKGSGTNAGYWDYATQSDTAPTAVTSGSTGIGSAGSTGNFANYNFAASWNGQTGNVTTVGTNGGASAYGLYDMGGNVWEWNDLTGAAGSSRGLRGGSWVNSFAFNLSSSIRNAIDPSGGSDNVGFRLASPVPEPATLGMASGGALCACGWWVLKRRRRART